MRVAAAGRCRTGQFQVFVRALEVRGVGRDGFLLDSLARAGIDAEMIGAIASSGFGSAESMGNQLGQGNLNMTMLEYNDGPVLFAPVGEEAFLVIVADKDTNLGWIRIAIKKNSKRIQEVAAL